MVQTRARITNSPSKTPPSEAMGPKASSRPRVAATETAPDKVPMPASALNCPAACSSTASGVRQARIAMIRAEITATTITSSRA